MPLAMAGAVVTAAPVTAPVTSTGCVRMSVGEAAAHLVWPQAAHHRHLLELGQVAIPRLGQGSSLGLSVIVICLPLLSAS